jgi:hypothetical protein
MYSAAGLCRPGQAWLSALCLCQGLVHTVFRCLMAPLVSVTTCVCLCACLRSGPALHFAVHSSWWVLGVGCVQAVGVGGAGQGCDMICYCTDWCASPAGTGSAQGKGCCRLWWGLCMQACLVACPPLAGSLLRVSVMVCLGTLHVCRLTCAVAG